MKFQYLIASGILDTRGKMVKRPMLEIELISKNGEKVPALGHIDSGADTTTINMQYAEALGLEIDKTKQRTIIGVGNGKVSVYESMLRFNIKHMNHEMSVPVWCVDSDNVNILLGQEVFFDNLKIKFEKDHNAFEITLSK